MLTDTKYEVRKERYELKKHIVTVEYVNGYAHDVTINHHVDLGGYTEKFSDGDFSDAVATLIISLVKGIDK